MFNALHCACLGFGQRQRTVKAIFVGCWALVVVVGFGALWNYALTPGKIGEPPYRWPTDSEIQRDNQRKTLLVFVHPHCPCTRASIGELARLMTQCENSVQAFVLIARPAGTSDDWEDTALCESAKQIPGIHTMSDRNGIEARRFHAKTSGMCILYDADGRLLFHGGITTARGHAGDNDGANAIVAWATTGESTVFRTPVFGCPILGEHEGGRDE